MTQRGYVMQRGALSLNGTVDREWGSQKTVLRQPRSTRQVLRLGTALLWALPLLLLGSGTAGARHAKRATAGSARVQDLLTIGQAQREGRDYEAARRSFGEAYRQTRRPEVLCLLGLVEAEAGQLLSAQDLLRRCSSGAADKLTATAQQVLAQRRPESGELDVQGPRQALLLVDDRLVGSLPLSQPLLLPVGQHVLQLQVGTRAATAAASPVTLQVRAGQVQQVRLPSGKQPSPEKVLALLLDATQSPADAQAALRQALVQGSQDAKFSWLGQHGSLAEEPDAVACGELPCQQALAQKHQLRYVLWSRAVAESGGFRLAVRLLDSEVADVAAEEEALCDSCSALQASEKLQQLTAQVLQGGTTRGTGLLEITSTPPGGVVLRRGLQLGQTPLRRASFAGEQAVVVQLAGYAPYRSEVFVDPGRGAAIDAQLQPERTAAEPSTAGGAPSGQQAQSAAAVDGAVARRNSASATTAQVASPAGPDPAVSLLTNVSIDPGKSQSSVAGKVPVEYFPRPRWRIVTGAVGVAAGVTLLGFGIAGLAVDGRCSVPTTPGTDGREVCSSGQVIDSRLSGGLLTAAGLVVTGVSATLWALPGERRSVELSAAASPSTVTAAVAGRF